MRVIRDTLTQFNGAGKVAHGSCLGRVAIAVLFVLVVWSLS